ncbi:MAG: pilus assembly protein N-terminal domain-containing protein [Candidatus Thiodiazotropha sp.]
MDNKRCMTSVALRHADAKVSVLDSSRVGPWLFLCLVTGLLLAMMPRLLFADTATEYSSVGSLDEQQSLSIPLNKSRVIKLPRSLGRVSVANPELVDILVINAYEIYLVGKKLGSTNAIIWDKRKRVQAIIGLQVTHDLAGLKQKLHRFLPDEKIEVTSSQGSIVLSGEVSGPQKMGAALGKDLCHEASGGEGQGRFPDIEPAADRRRAAGDA